MLFLIELIIIFSLEMFLCDLNIFWSRVVLCCVYLFYFSLIAFYIQQSLLFPGDNHVFYDLKALCVSFLLLSS